MKNIIYILFLVMAIIPACGENPVITESQPSSYTIQWDSVYFSAQQTTYSANSNGATFIIGGGDFSNCSFVRIKLKYISIYKKYFLAPSMSVSNSTFYCYLKNDTYSSLDTIVSSKSFKDIGLVYLGLVNAKLSFDTLMILKGTTNY